jgi:hypothetical protein
MRELSLELLYLMAIGSSMRLFMPLRGEESLDEAKGRSIEGDDAYAMIKYWPDHEEVFDLNPGPGKMRFFQIHRVDEKVSANPLIQFTAEESVEDAARMVPILEEHFREWMKPEKLDGLDLYSRMSAIVQHRLVWERMQTEREEDAKAAAEEKRRHEEKKAQFKDSDSKFYQAELSIKHGERFTTTATLGYNYTTHKSRDSSMRAALKLLRLPETLLAYMEEGPGDPTKEGFTKVEIGLAKRGVRLGEPTTFINYSAPPVATLVEQAALKADTPKARAPRKPLRERRGVL